MATTELLERLLHGELTAAEAAEVLEVPEGRVLDWMRANAPASPQGDSHPTPRALRNQSTQMRYVLDLYRQRYANAPVTTFRTALKNEHHIVIAYRVLRRELLGAGALPDRKIALWRPEASAARKIEASARRDFPSRSPTEAPDGAPAAGGGGEESDVRSR